MWSRRRLLKVNLRAEGNGEVSYDAEIVGTDKETDWPCLRSGANVSLPYLS
jgi:serine protease Do